MINVDGFLNPCAFQRRKNKNRNLLSMGTDDVNIMITIKYSVATMSFERSTFDTLATSSLKRIMRLTGLYRPEMVTKIIFRKVTCTYHFD